MLRASPDHPKQSGSFVSKEFPKHSDLPDGIPYEGTVYRYEYPERVETTWEVHKGNIMADHRYSEPGKGAVYAGTKRDTALSEVKYYGVEEGRVLSNQDKLLNNVLDLTDPRVREQMGITENDLVGNSYKTTQSIGSAARENGYDGILAPSARDKQGSNLIIFPENH
jgi:RES domain-containing protein